MAKDINIHEWKHNIRMIDRAVENKVWDIYYMGKIMSGNDAVCMDMSCNRADMRCWGDVVMWINQW